MIQNRILSNAFLALALVALSLPAVANPGPIAQIICAPGAEMRLRLEGQYQSQRAWAGIRSPEEVMELWEGPHGDWTLVVTRASGNWCIVAMGDALMPVQDAPQS